jgi:polar amino acid transport system permease protein
MNHVWNYSPIWEYREAIIQGVGGTLMLTLLSCVIGTVLGLTLALALVRGRSWSKWAITVFIELFRACPPLVLLLWAYYLLPAVTGIGFSAMVTAVVSFTLVFACFAADIFRGAIESIPRATLDSGRAIGMRGTTLIRRIIVPEVFRRSLPALNAQTVGMLKMSSLASVIAVGELTYTAQLILVQRPLPFEIYTATAGIYVLMILPLVVLLRWVERQPWCAMNPVSHASS